MATNNPSPSSSAPSLGASIWAALFSPKAQLQADLAYEKAEKEKADAVYYEDSATKRGHYYG